ncbi:MAG TPA: hypothetical protein VG818_02720 [Gemmatimonadaceae bacterium]|nr:hypothetical protein [Gemmatimonadaceae bacterium]
MAIVILALVIVLVLVARRLPGDRRAAVIRQGIAMAFKVGVVAFAAGFLGPMIFAPGANQGPMLGIFITGPLGFVFGGLYGMVRGWRQTAQ